MGLNAGGQRFEWLQPTPDKHHVGPLTGEEVGHRRPHAAASADDKRDLSLEPLGAHLLGSRPMIGGVSAWALRLP